MDNTSYVGQMVVVGSIGFDDVSLDVYYSLDEPLFRSDDVAKMIGLDKATLNIICEQDEILSLSMLVNGKMTPAVFVNEHGLYSVLSQSSVPIAHKWRRVVHDEIIRLRKEQNKNVTEKFQEWDHSLGGIYYDEKAGILMQSITVQGGDVIQVPYEKKEK